MKMQNGVHIYATGEEPDYEVPLESMEGSKFGYKLIGAGIDAHWVPAAEEDYRASESRRLEIATADVDLNRLCKANGRFCDFSSCGPGSACNLVFDPKSKTSYCVCS